MKFKIYLYTLIFLISSIFIPSSLFAAAGANVWNAATDVTDDASWEQKNPVIVSDDSDGSIVIWEHYRTEPSEWGWIQAQKVNSTGTVVWAAGGAAISTSAYISVISYLRAIADGNGGAIAVWQDFRKGDYDVYCQGVDSSGNKLWSGDIVVSSGTGHQRYPDICSDGNGGAVIVWQDDSGALSNVYSQRISSSGARVWNSTGVAVCTAGAYARENPKVAFDQSSNALIVWNEDERTSGNEEDIFIQKLAVSDGVMQWSSNGVAISSTTGIQRYPDIIDDGSNGAVVAWWEEVIFPTVTPYVQRVSSAGTIMWPANGKKVSTHATPYSDTNSEFSLSRDTGTPYGGTFIAWTDQRNEVAGTDVDIFMQYFGGDSFTRFWFTSEDIHVSSTAASSQIYPRIVATPDNEAIVSWFDSNDNSVKAQKINQTGSWWGDGYGIEVSTPNETSGNVPVLVSDSYAGAYVAWWDNQGSNNNIYLQRVGDGDESNPSPVSALTALTGSEPDSIEITWIAPGDDGTVGAAYAYVVKHATYSAYTGGWSTATWWNNADTYSQSWSPKVYGSTEAAIIYLTSNVTYYIFMKARDDAGNWGGLSNPATAYARYDDMPPPEISDLQASRNGVVEGQIKLVWSSPYDNDTYDTGIAEYYEIRYSSSTPSFVWNTATVWADSRTVTSPAESTETEIITGLIPKTTYYFRIQSRDEIPNWSGISSGATTWAQSDITAPGKITTLAALPSATTGWINLQWQAPGDDGYTNPLDSCTFHIRYSSVTAITSDAIWSNGTLYALNVSSNNVNAASFRYYSVTGLIDDTTYYFNMKTSDELNNTSNLNGVDVHAKTKDIVAPADITDLLGVPGSREVEILLTWTAPGDNGTVGNIIGGEYRLQYSTYPDTTWDKNDSSVVIWATNTSYGVNEQYRVSFSTDVEYNTTFYMRLWLTDETGTLWTGLSNGATAYTSNDINPSDVSDFTASTLSGLANPGSILLAWTAPGDDDVVGTVTSYIIKYSTGPFDCSSDSSTWNASWIHLITELAMGAPPSPSEYGTAETMKVSGLANQTTYYFALRSVDDRGNYSGITATVYAVTIDTIPPAMITVITQFPPKEKSLQLAWTAPGDDGMLGDIVSGEYWIKTTVSSTDTWSSVSDSDPYPWNIKISTSISPGTNCVQVITGLRQLTTYYLWVKIRDERSPDDVFGSWSALPAKTTDVTRIDGLIPSTISDLTVNSTYYGTVTLSWTTPSDNDGWLDDFDAGTDSGAVTPRYELRYSTTGLIAATTTSFSNAVAVSTSMISSLLTGSTVPTQAGIPEKWIISNLTNYVSYYFAIQTFDERSNESGISTTSVVVPPDSTPPVIASYTQLTSINHTGNYVVIRATTTDNLSGIEEIDLCYRLNSTGSYSTYSMYSGTATIAPGIRYGQISLPTTTVTSIQYYIKAVDRCFNEVFSTGESRRFGVSGYGQTPSSPHSIAVSTYTYSVIGLSGGTLEVEDGNSLDGTTRIIIPPYALAGDITISIYPLDTGQLSADQVLGAQGDVRIKTKTPVSFIRVKPDELMLLRNATFYIQYVNNVGNVNLVDGTSVVETDLMMFSWDGFMWRLKQSTVYAHTVADATVRNTVKASIGHFSDYALFEVDTNQLSVDDARPKENIITPNGDGINDRAEFSGLDGNYELNILDINGRRVRRFVGSTNGDSPAWNGKDSDGNVVSSGLYIYQIKDLDDASTDVLSGVIVVAK